LKQAGLKFDEVFLKLQGAHTATFKQFVMAKLHGRHRFTHIHIWDDMNTGQYKQFAEKLGVLCTVHPVPTHERPPLCTQESMGLVEAAGDARPAAEMDHGDEDEDEATAIETPKKYQNRTNRCPPGYRGNEKRTCIDMKERRKKRRWEQQQRAKERREAGR
jgi:hypothetical protein